MAAPQLLRSIPMVANSPSGRKRLIPISCPVLIGDRIVAALDLKTDRQRQNLLVQRWNWVGGGAASAHRHGVEAALHRFEKFQLRRS
jgi:hypothetical protein